LSSTPEKTEKTRYEVHGADSDMVNQPFPEGAELLIDCFKESGMYLSNGMGIVPLTWEEINQFMTRYYYDWLFIAKALRRMSESYIAAHYAGKDPLSPSPLLLYYGEDEATIRRQHVENQLRNMILGNS
jgi:hypothetical protein